MRYGGYGGIVYRHVADSYIALFTRFIPREVWEAVHLFEGLLDHKATTITGEVVHTDTQAESLPAFGLAAMPKNRPTVWPERRHRQRQRIGSGESPRSFVMGTQCVLSMETESR
ncbi:Tn3 family transposase [Actinomadura rayongensis]|uniref:Tn3 family transposase n=1 Tax=Actinomadura rayongensis TaxID=1429076 RepID=A0A6I4WFH8_9ACTN|nr:Tn3 family transposase [Actinomadura rayongensis]